MNDNQIRDKWGKLIGWYDGRYLRNANGRIVARYDESDDYTRTETGTIVGKGDQRMRLLK